MLKKSRENFQKNFPKNNEKIFGMEKTQKKSRKNFSKIGLKVSGLVLVSLALVGTSWAGLTREQLGVFRCEMAGGQVKLGFARGTPSCVLLVDSINRQLKNLVSKLAVIESYGPAQQEIRVVEKNAIQSEILRLHRLRAAVETRALGLAEDVFAELAPKIQEFVATEKSRILALAAEKHHAAAPGQNRAENLVGRMRGLVAMGAARDFRELLDAVEKF